MKVLVLDDKILLVKDIIRDVKKVVSGAECVGFHRAPYALEYARKNPVDVALLDIDMPNMNGISVAQNLLSFHPRANIIFVAGYPEYALDSYKVSASDFLVKPLDDEELRAAFSRLRHPVVGTDGCHYDLRNLSDKIKRRRIEQNINVKDFADSLGVSFQTIYRWESGERIPDTAMLLRIAETLNITIDELVSYTNP